MTKFASVLIVAAVAVMVGGTAYAEDGNVDNATLSAMGLGDLAVMSDADGMQVRGQGYYGSRSYAKVWGSGFALYKKEGSYDGESYSGSYKKIAIEKNGYEAKGKHYAKGANIAIVGKAGGSAELDTSDGSLSGTVNFYPKAFAFGYSKARAY